MSNLFLAALSDVFSLEVLLLLFVGTVFGIIGGATPGISGAMTLALFLPISYSLAPTGAISMMIALFVGAMSGGLIAAVLLKIPGTPASVATTFDGIPLAEKGDAGKALGVGIVFSFIGGIFSIILLILVAPTLARVTIEFSYYEYFAIGVFSLTIISAIGGTSTLKNFIGGLFGFFISFVGSGAVSPFPRFTMGIRELRGGFNILTVMIGFYAVTQLIEAALERNQPASAEVDIHPSSVKIKGFGFSWQEFKGQIGNALIASSIGAGIGILPGLGGGVANLASYAAVKKHSRHPEKFGTGIIDGVVASEASNNATVGGALIPLMALGIPGDNATAVLLASFMVKGITPGPLLFEKHAQLVYGIFIAAFLAHFFMIAVEFIGIRAFVRILAVKRYILLPIVASLCVVGAYTVNNRVFDIWCIIGFGVLGYVLKKFGFSLATVILGIILGPIVELNYCRGMQRSLGSFAPFVTTPISGAILGIAVVMLIWTLYSSLKRGMTGNT